MKLLCISCPHERLEHDSWGCKVKCGCLISIVYSTPLFSENSNPAEDEESIKSSNELVALDDRVAESHIRRLARRVAEPPNHTEFSTLE